MFRMRLRCCWSRLRLKYCGLLLIHAKGMSLRYDGIALRYDGLRYDGIVIRGFDTVLSEKSLLLLGGWYFKRWGWYFGRVEVLVGKQLRYIFAT